jgi:hypothetical protein
MEKPEEEPAPPKPVEETPPPAPPADEEGAKRAVVLDEVRKVQENLKRRLERLGVTLGV